MEIRHLSYFVEVAEQQSFTKAARRLNVSQPALSKCISNLEEEFGLKLFVRRAGSIALTEDGQAALEIARELLSHFQDAQEQMNELGSRKKAAVAVGCSPILHALLGGKLFPDAVGERCRVSCLEAPAEALIRETANHRLDLALCFFCRSEPHADLNRVKVEPFRSGALVAAVNAAEQPFVPEYESLPPDRKIVSSIELLPFLQENARYYSAVVYTEDLGAMRDYVLKQGYIAVIPDFAAPFMGEGVRIDPLRHPESYSLAFLTAQGSRLSRDAREIRRYLEAQL